MTRRCPSPRLRGEGGAKRWVRGRASCEERPLIRPPGTFSPQAGRRATARLYGPMMIFVDLGKRMSADTPRVKTPLYQSALFGAPPWSIR